MTPTKAIHIGIVICALLWVGLMVMPESLQWTVPGLWLATLPLAGWVLAVAARRSAMRRAILWSWALVLVLLPGASISYVLAEQFHVSALIGIADPGSLEPLAPLAIAVSMLWPAILIALLFLFKWTASGQEAEAGSLSQV